MYTSRVSFIIIVGQSTHTVHQCTVSSSLFSQQLHLHLFSSRITGLCYSLIIVIIIIIINVEAVLALACFLRLLVLIPFPSAAISGDDKVAVASARGGAHGHVGHAHAMALRVPGQDGRGGLRVGGCYAASVVVRHLLLDLRVAERGEQGANKRGTGSVHAPATQHAA